MSIEVVRQVIVRASAEPEFRTRLYTHPALALSGYELTEAEVRSLSSMPAESFDQVVAGLESRVSQAVVSLYPQPTGFPPEVQPSGFPPVEAQPTGFPPVTVEVQPTGF
jgi:hypothetical protein